VPARILRTRRLDRPAAPTLAPTLELAGGRLVAHCGGGGLLHVLALELDGATLAPEAFAARFGAAPVPLGGPADTPR
jgi:hypothetical protein